MSELSPSRPSFGLRLLLAVASGGLYSLAYPPLGWGWLVFPAVAGLLVALKDLTGSRARAVGFLHGLAAFAAGLSWLYELFGLLAVVLWFVLSFFPAMFVCATSGVSQVIDPNGQLHGRLGAMDSGTLVGTLKRETRLTFYTRFGWLTPWVVLAAAGGWWAALLLAGRRGAGRAEAGMA